MEVIRYSDEYKKQWNIFLETSKNSTFLFNRNFMDYHKERFTDYSLIVKNDTRNIVALMPANITADNVLVSHQGLSYGGLVVEKDEKLLDFISLFKLILEYLHQQGIENFIYKEIPSFYNSVPSDEASYAFFLLQAKLLRRDTASTIRIDQDIPYQKRRLKSIRAAKKAGIEIRHDNDFEQFWNKVMIPNLLERYGVLPVHSLEEICRLQQQFPNNIKQHNAYLNGQIMAGTTIFETPTVAHSQYFHGNMEGKSNGSIDLLCDVLIKEVYKEKNFFDFGISNENNGLNVNKGLIDWKEGFGGRSYSHNFYEIKTQNYTLLENFIL